jgi:predicted DNA repair protein MutK
VEDAAAFEQRKIASAIKTDFILSAEIMAITLAAVPEGSSFWMQLAVLAAVGLGITLIVYGAVALIVKADDAGVAMATSGGGGAVRAFGRGLVRGMPVLLKALSVIGTAAMIWVGGGIILHGLEEYGLGGPAHGLHEVAAGAGRMVPVAHGFVEWLVTAAGAGVAGLAVGAVIVGALHLARPLLRRGAPAPHAG